MRKKIHQILLAFTTIIVLSLIVVYFFRNTEEKNVVRDFPEIQLSDNLNIVTEYNAIDYYIVGDSIKGIQYNLSKYIEEISDLNVNIFLENNLERSIRKLKEKEYDIIARNIPVTQELKEELAFTIPISKGKQVLVQREKTVDDSTFFISNQIELANKTVYVTWNSPAILRIKNLSEEIAEPIYINEDHNYTAEQLLYMVAYDEIDYAVIDENIALCNQRMFPNININTDIGFNQLQAWAVRKDSPVLLDSLNSWIQQY
ncbi:MAG: transporter substrate-binding domain-containing protein, partial [Bacteroidales bacterium]|nr:transporter substrate-binding domain-containing protein [Bacteroidales bacterium]